MKNYFKKNVYVIIVFAVCVIGFFSSFLKNKGENNTPINTNGFAVIELFTSEGCSSCPPADEAVANILKEYKSNVYVLGYHVDYWDNLGWKDIFSNAAYTNLQKSYAHNFKLSSVYTPQIVVNGTTQFVGSNVSKLHQAINASLQTKATTNLTLHASANNNMVTVNYNCDPSSNMLHIALVQLSAQNKIARGENTGATLHHVNVVRDLQTVNAGNGAVNFHLPENISKSDCNIVAFVQNKNDLKITAATQTSIQ